MTASSEIQAYVDAYPAVGAIWTPNVPPFTIRWYGPGESCTDPLDGDLLLIAHGTKLAALIRTGERIVALSDKGLEPFCWSNHSACVLTVDGEICVSEMAAKGNQVVPLSTYDHKLYAVVSFKITVAQRAAVVQAINGCMGIEYGYWQYPFLALAALHLPFAGGTGETMICSTMSTMCQMAAGLWPDRQPIAMMPAHLARLVNAIPPEQYL